MFGRMVGRLWNRRKDQKRFPLQLGVRASSSEESQGDLVSEDVSGRGIRLRSNGGGTPLSHIVGKHGEAPLEISLEEDVPPIKVRAQIVWSYSNSSGATISGWQFMNFHGNARRRLRAFLERVAEEENG